MSSQNEANKFLNYPYIYIYIYIYNGSEKIYLGFNFPDHQDKMGQFYTDDPAR